MKQQLSQYIDAIPWSPKSQPQRDAFFTEADLTLYGGAAGGGKTSLSIGLALVAHRDTLFIRRESKQLGGVLDHIAELIEKKLDYIFLPSIVSMTAHYPENEHNKLCPYVQSLAYQAQTAFADKLGNTKILTTLLRMGEERLRCCHGSNSWQTGTAACIGDPNGPVL